MFLYLTLYIQDVLGYSPLQAGLRFLPVTLLSFAVAPVAGKLSVRVPVRLLLGSGLVLAGVGLLAMTTVSAGSGWTTLIPGFVLGGAGIGMINPPLASTAIGVVPPERSGMASGINSTFRQVGIATGIAGLGAIFQHSVTNSTHTTLAASGHAGEIASAAHGHLATILESGEVSRFASTLPTAAQTALVHAYRVGFTGAFTTIAIIAALVALVGGALAFVLVRGRDFVSSGPAPAAPSAPETEPAGVLAG
jgi:MFS family permease